MTTQPSKSKSKPVAATSVKPATNIAVSTQKKSVAPTVVKDADATRTNILNVAMRAFAEKGLSGSRIDEIAEATGSNKRMIYYYFGSKQGLFLAALEECYARIRLVETAFHQEQLPPVMALRKLVELTIEHQAANPDFVRLVMSENIHKGKHIRQLPQIRELNKSAIILLKQLCDRGVKEGVFRRNIDPIDLHMFISALAVFNVANQYTFSYIFQRDVMAPKVFKARLASIVDVIERYVRV